MKLVTTGPGAARPDGVIFDMLEVGQVEISRCHGFHMMFYSHSCWLA